MPPPLADLVPDRRTSEPDQQEDRIGHPYHRYKARANKHPDLFRSRCLLGSRQKHEHNKSHNLLNVLNRLADMGNTIVIIEHNLDVVKCADWIIDLGPEGGQAGGRIVAEGTPEQVAAGDSYTGQFLTRHLAAETQTAVQTA